MGGDAAALHPASLTSIIRKYFLMAFVAWTTVIAAIFIWGAHETRRFVLKEAQSNALASYNKDVAFREWATTHGGVYVPVDETTPPNPYLTNIKERDLITPSGRHLTLMNPAYMARQMNDFFAQKGNVFGHITSLNLKNPVNKPDKWEEDALRAFEKGEKERIEVTDVGGKPFLRLIRPMVTREGCLKCHADQGYKVGDIRGGVGVSVALEPYYAEARALTREHATAHGLIWLVGSLGLLFGHGYARRLGRARDEAKEEAESALKTARESDEKIHLLLNSMGEAIYGIDLDGNCTFYNSSCLGILGYKDGNQLLGKNMHDLIHHTRNDGTPYPNEECKIYKVFREGIGVHIDDEVLWRADGTRFAAEYRSLPIWRDGKIIGSAVTFTDITGRKAAEERLKAAKDVAEAATVMKDKFVSLVSHDLKNPLSSMLGFLKLALDDTGEQVNEGAKLILINAINSGKHMARLIDDLLNISRIRAGGLKLNKQFLDAKYLGAMMIANYSYLAGQKGIEIGNTIPDNSRIYGDKTLLTEAIQNLVTNAIKFCNKGDHVTISLAEGAPSTICVRDTGPGIQPERLSGLFDYSKKTSTKGTAGEQGTGFGLPLVKDIMELHGGELEMKCEFGKGCLFGLKLPYVRPKILLVDDDRSFRYLQILNLKAMNATIIEAENGEDALNMMESARPHLIITDIKMPIMDGLELLRRIKGAPETKDIPVIVVSGEFGMEIRDTVFKLGADDFATKDINSVDFIPRVRRFIG